MLNRTMNTEQQVTYLIPVSHSTQHQQPSEPVEQPKNPFLITVTKDFLKEKSTSDDGGPNATNN